MNSKEYQDKIKEFSDDLDRNLEEYDASFSESQNLYSLKNYIDKRFDLLTKYLGQYLDK